MLMIPYTPDRLRAQTALWGVVAGAQFFDVSGSDTAYWRLLYAHWDRSARGQDLIVVEHDIIPDDAAYTGMLYCTLPWCVSPYPIRADGHLATSSLGLARFSAALQAAEPDLMQSVGPGRSESVANGLWSRLDGAISAILRRRGYRPHRHHNSTHLHDYINARTPHSNHLGKVHYGAQNNH